MITSFIISNSSSKNNNNSNNNNNNNDNVAVHRVYTLPLLHWRRKLADYIQVKRMCDANQACSADEAELWWRSLAARENCNRNNMTSRRHNNSILNY